MGAQNPGDSVAIEAETSDIESANKKRINIKMALVAGAMGLLIGGFAVWATINLGISTIAFLIGTGGGAYFLYQKDMPSEAVGSGLYITALVMILTPILFYLPNVVAEGDGSAEAAGTFIGSILGLVIWGFVFLLLAIVTAAVGYFFKRRAAKKRDAAANTA